MNKMHRRTLRSIMPLLSLFFLWMLLVLGCGRFIPGGNTATDNSRADNSLTNTPRTNNTTSSPTAQKPSTKAMAWMLGSNLSLAALMHERGVKKSADDFLARANILSRELTGGEVPALPAMVGDRVKDGTAVMGYLLNTSLPAIGGKIKTAHGTEHADLFELAVKSNTLLLIYGPGDDIGKSVSGFIKRVAPRAGLPETSWKPVTDKVDAGASFDEVKEAVFKMHSDVRAHLESAR